MFSLLCTATGLGTIGKGGELRGKLLRTIAAVEKLMQNRGRRISSGWHIVQNYELTDSITADTIHAQSHLDSDSTVRLGI